MYVYYMTYANLRHNFCGPGPISNPRPVLDCPAKTTRVMVLGLFVKPQNMLFRLVTAFWFFPVFFRHRPFELKIDFY